MTSIKLPFALSKYKLSYNLLTFAVLEYCGMNTSSKLAVLVSKLTKPSCDEDSWGKLSPPKQCLHINKDATNTANNIKNNNSGVIFIISEYSISSENSVDNKIE